MRAINEGFQPVIRINMRNIQSLAQLLIAGLITALALSSASGSVLGGQKALSPTETAIGFYTALREKRYTDGFGLSVYRDAIQGLPPEDLKQLEPDFARTFSGIPAKIEPAGEHIDGDAATVSLKFEGISEPQTVALVRFRGRWLVGDTEALHLVQSQGKEFFFNARMLVNEGEAAEMLSRIVGAETIYYGQKEGVYAALRDLIKLGGVPKDLEGGVASGYKIAVVVGSDQKSFIATAEPVQYGRTGKLSFYADGETLRAEDLKGKPATANSPPYKGDSR
jgi:hypothetical protein